MIPALVSLVVSSVLAIAYKKKEKKDEGFAYNYFRLSYRRKFIRTLMGSWIIVPCMVIFLVTSPMPMRINWTFAIAIIIVFLLQATYNYSMWKKKEE